MNNEMNHIDPDLEALIRQIELDEPSVSFTGSVMKAIVLQPQPLLKKTRFSWLWFLLLVPFGGISFWVISLKYDVTSSGFQLWNTISVYLIQLKTSFLYLTEKINHITFSPLIFAGLAAAIMLLTIDELFKRKNALHRDIFPES